MKEVIISIVQNFPAMLAAFGAIVQYGDDDADRLANLEKVVFELQTRLNSIQLALDVKKKER